MGTLGFKLKEGKSRFLPMKFLFKLLFCISSFNCLSQTKPILVFDLQNSSLDSLAIPTIDNSISRGQTQFYIGNYNGVFANLDSIIPSTNIFPNSQFSLKTRVDENYNLNDFPIRATVALFRWKNDSLAQLCSGNMISPKHALLAAHCISRPDTSSPLHQFDSLMVSPAYNNGIYNANFRNSKVKKIFLFRSWNFFGEDMAVLELEEDIGLKTGYIGIGFNDNKQDLEDDLFYKFSYPAVSYFLGDSNAYNGDTLYSSFGLLDFFSPTIIGVNNAIGVPGESGSSFIRIRPYRDYTSFGVMSFANKLSHSRFNNFRFHSIKAIIENDLLSEGEPKVDQEVISIYPNPCDDGFYLDLPQNQKITGLRIFDAFGKLVQVNRNLSGFELVNISDLKSGFYNLEIEVDSEKQYQKFIKK